MANAMGQTLHGLPLPLTAEEVRGVVGPLTIGLVSLQELAVSQGAVSLIVFPVLQG
jgi:hypothetical protein